MTMMREDTISTPKKYVTNRLMGSVESFSLFPGKLRCQGSNVLVRVVSQSAVRGGAPLFAMGRGRRAGPSSSDQSDDGSSLAGGLSTQLAKGKGGGKRWTPGMSGKEQKARAKEQRLEQERRKAERDKRNEDKQAKREQEEEASAIAVTPPKASNERSKRRGQANDVGSFPPVGTPPKSINHQHHQHLDAHQIRRDLRRLFGRIEHGGGLAPGSGRAVAVTDVFVLALVDSIGDRRKSGADAWSARVQKGTESELSLAAFLGERDDAFSASPMETTYEKEPPYHRVRRVVARYRDEDGDDVEEVLWDLHSVVVDDATRSLGTTHLSSSPDKFGSLSRYPYGSHGGSPGTNVFHLDGTKHKTHDAMDLLPSQCWEDVMSYCDVRGVVRFGGTCVALAEIARSQAVRQAQHVAMFGRQAPIGPMRAPLAPARLGAPPAAPASPAALESAAAKKGWAATCASFVAADAWIPRERLFSGIGGDANEDEDEEDEDVEFDDDDDDFGESSGAQKCAAASPSAPSSDPPSVPRPTAKYTGVGPYSAQQMLANAATAVSCDGNKIKLWFHGGDGHTESGKRIATLPNPAGSKPWCSLTASAGLFVAGDQNGDLTVWDADALEVRHARLAGVVRWDDDTNEMVDLNKPLSALATVPTSGLVACGSYASSVVRLIDVTPENAGAPVTLADVNLHEHHVDEHEDLYTVGDPPGVCALVVSSAGDAYRDVSGVRTFTPSARLGASAPKLWAACSNRSFSRDHVEVSDQKLVVVDLETFLPTERFEVPDYGISYRRSAALATHGDLIVLACEGIATMWDMRLASSSSSDPVAVFWDEADIRKLQDEREIGRMEPSGLGHVAVDDWAVWVSRSGGDGVRLYDARRVSGPPRGRERWHCGDSIKCPPVAIYGADAHNAIGGPPRGSAPVGAFARAGNGALVVAPSRDSSNLRCSVYTSGHHGESDELSRERNSEEGDAWEDGFAKPKEKNKAAKKVRKKYPKRQGGKFRARTAGG